MSTFAIKPDEHSSFSDVMVDQIRSTPWMLLSLIVHLAIGMILSFISTQPVERTLVRQFNAMADLPDEIEQPPQVVDEDQAVVDPDVKTDAIDPVDNPDDNDLSDDTDAPTDEPAGDDTDANDEPMNLNHASSTVGIGAGGAGSQIGSGGKFKGRGPGGVSGGVPPSIVRRGLTWLKQHQSKDGRWDGDGFMGLGDPKLGPLCDGRGTATHDVGLTGLALLAFLGAGNTHRDGEFKDTVRRGLKWLRDQQDSQGCFGSRSDPHFTYDHAIAALAMTEAYGMTKSGLWRSSAQAGIDFCIKCQNPYKAWRYGEQPGNNDVSVTGWMVMALKSAKISGLQTSDTSLRWAHDFIKEMTDESTGRTGYEERGSLPVRAEGRVDAFPASESESLTAVGILTRIFADEDPRTSEAIKAGSELLTKRLPVWEPQTGKVDMYYWYYGTLAMFQVGGASWVAWNGKMNKAVVDSQRKDGNYRGSWDPVGPWGQDGGRIYSTAVMTMCLEVYYRYGRVFGTR